MNQKKNIQLCNHFACEDEGIYRAPLNKLNLNVSQWFCLVHIKEFNKSWNYHKEMDADQIENELKKDSTWRRPTKPFGSGQNYYNFDFEDYTKEKTSNYNKSTNKYMWSLNQLELNTKSTINEIKNNYKRFAKIYHPDAKSEIENSDEKFRNIVESYKYLMEYYKR